MRGSNKKNSIKTKTINAVVLKSAQNSLIEFKDEVSVIVFFLPDTSYIPRDSAEPFSHDLECDYTSLMVDFALTITFLIDF